MLSNNYIVCILGISIILILILYVVYSKKEFFYETYNISDDDKTCVTVSSGGYDSQERCETMWKCDEGEGGCKMQPVERDDALIGGKVGVENPYYTNNLYNGTIQVSQIGHETQDLCQENCKFISKNNRCRMATKEELGTGDTLYSRKHYCTNRYDCSVPEGKCIKKDGGDFALQRTCERNCSPSNNNENTPKLKFIFVEDLSSLSEFDNKLFKKKITELLSTYTDIYSKYIISVSEPEAAPAAPATTPSSAQTTPAAAPAAPAATPEAVYKSKNIVTITLLNYYDVKKIYKSIDNEGEYKELIQTGIDTLSKKLIKIYISFQYYTISKITLNFPSEESVCIVNEYVFPTEKVIENIRDYIFLEIENISNKLKTKVLIPNIVNKTKIQDIDTNKKNDILVKMDNSLKHKTLSFDMPPVTKLYKSNKVNLHYETPIDTYQKLSFFAVDEEYKSSFEYRPYFEKDVIDEIILNNIDIKMLVIGTQDPNHIFDMVNEIYIILFKTQDGSLKYRLLKLDLDLYTKFKYEEAKENISTSPNKLNIYAGIYKRLMGNYNKKIEYKHVLYDIYKDTVDFELKVNIFNKFKLINILIYNEDISLAPSAIKCTYDPSGTTLYECKQACYNGIDDVLNPNLCKKSECESLCNNCMNLGCKWNITDYRSDLSLKPPKARIKAFSGNNSIKVTWIKPYSNTAISQYYILVESANGQFFNIYVNKSESELNEYIIQNLSNDIIYRVTVISKNKFGVSEQSNIENIIPNANKSFDANSEKIEMSQYNDALENYYKTSTDNSNVLDSTTKYQNQIALFERELVINDLKDLLVDKLIGKPNINMYNLNIY